MSFFRKKRPIDPEERYADAIVDVIKVWTSEGSRPHQRRRVVRQLRKDWPRLADALDELYIAAIGREEPDLDLYIRSEYNYYLFPRSWYKD